MVFYFVLYTALFSSSLPLFLFIINSKRNHLSIYDARLFFIFLGAKFLFDCLAFTFEKLISNSIPIIHVSGLVEFILIIFLLKRIQYYSFFKWFLFIGVLASILDIFVISSLFSSNIFSSIINFGLIIFYCVKILSLQQLIREYELFSSTIFLYYVVALTYTIFQKFHFNTSTFADIAFYFFALVTIAYNISLSKLVCIMKKK